MGTRYSWRPNCTLPALIPHTRFGAVLGVIKSHALLLTGHPPTPLPSLEDLEV